MAKSLTEVTNAMFKNRKDWKDITDDDKKANFFIINRYLSKQYPDKSELLNDKSIDAVLAMDIWFAFMKKQPYPSWLWSKSEKIEKKNLFSEKDLVFLQNEFNIKSEELDILVKYHTDELKDELKYLKSQLIN